MKHTALIVVFLSVWCTVSMTAAFVTEGQAMDVPTALKPWQKWVLHDKEQQQCPSHFDDAAIHRCWWPSRLTVNADNQGGWFDLQVTVYAPTWVTLPGNGTHWPESVTSGKNVLAVAGRNGNPSVWLEPGDYRIKGGFLWNGLPEMLRVPPATGILFLTVNGRDVVKPDLGPNGRLRLHGKGSGARREDTMTATLFRLIEDNIPMRVTTRIMLEVSGRPREIRLASLLHDNGTVMKIDSPLPARLAGNGDLLLQGRPGRWSGDDSSWRESCASS